MHSNLNFRKGSLEKRAQSTSLCSARSVAGDATIAFGSGPNSENDNQGSEKYNFDSATFSDNVDLVRVRCFRQVLHDSHPAKTHAAIYMGPNFLRWASRL